MQEYELEIKPTKLVKGKGLAKLMAESIYQAIDLNFMTTNIMETGKGEEEVQEPISEVSLKFVESDWYKDIIVYLQNLSCSPLWNKAKDRSIKLKVVKYCIVGEFCFWKDLVGIMLNFLMKEET
jgi:hypothetical protein